MFQNGAGGGGGVAHDLTISMFGGFEVMLDGDRVPDDAWRRNRAKALVKVLALASGHRLHREQLSDVLWPALGPDAASGNLRKAVHFARQALGAGHVRTRGETIDLQAGNLATDVEAFEAAARAGRRAEALGIYRGDLLPEDRFEPWAEDPRERLRTRFHRLLSEEAAELERAGRLQEAADLLERLIASDPLHEDAHLGLMRVLAAAGSRHLALATYRQLETRLRAELDVEPEPNLRLLAHDIADGRFPPTDRADQATLAGEQLRVVVDDELRLVTVVSGRLGADAAREAAVRGSPESASERAAAIVRAWGGTVECAPGGELLAVFGVPVAHEDDATRALRAALEIDRLAPGAGRIGVATGEVVVRGGSDPPLRRTSGAALDEATSLREAADPGAVLVGERTRLATRGSFRLEARTAAPGVLRETAVWRLVGHEAAPASSAPAATPLIGREAELTAVLGLFEETVAGARPRLVELSGPAGVGKSRLAAEVIDRILARWPHAMVLRGRCQSAGRGAPFDALGEILRDVCGIGIADSAGAARDCLRSSLSPLLAGLPPADAEQTKFALATTAGIALDGNPLERLSPSDVADRLALAWPVLASACAARAPTVLFVEDVHWARPELLDLIERIVRRAEGPLLVLVTARPELREMRPVFGVGAVSTITIPPLVGAESDRLLDHLVGKGALSPTVRADLLARAEGNPFFLEQLSHHLRSGGSSTLPDTLHSLLTARLDALPGPERRVLQQASVVGRVFWEAPLAAALEGERVGARLAGLERKGFVVRRSVSSLAGQAEYSFGHALLHDVAYESLPQARRARAHASAGAWLEGLVGERAAEVVELLAQHYWAALAPNVPDLAPDEGFDRGEIRSLAFGYLLRAGDAARRRFVTDRALELHRRALGIARTENERIAALEALGRDYEDEFHGDDAARHFREALELARVRGAGPDRARLCRRLAWMMAWNPGSFRINPDAAEAELLVDEATLHATDAVERAWLLLARGACARLYRGSEPLGQGDVADPRPIEERLAAVEAGLAAGRALGRDEVVVAAEHVLGLLYGLAGKYDEMVRLASRQVAALRPNDSRLDQSDAIRKLAIHLINVRADFEQGLELGRQCRALVGSSGAGGPHQVMHTLWPILASLFFLGRWGALLEPLVEHVEAFRQEPATQCQFVRDGPAIGATTLILLGREAEAQVLRDLLGNPLANLASASAWQARLALAGGDPPAARAIAADKAGEGRVYGPQHAAVLLDALGELQDWESASAFLPVARAAAVGNALIEPIADRLEARVTAAAGDAGGALVLARRAVLGFAGFKVPFEEARTHSLLAQLGSATEAEEARAAARDLYDRLGYRPNERPAGPGRRVHPAEFIPPS